MYGFPKTTLCQLASSQSFSVSRDAETEFKGVVFKVQVIGVRVQGIGFRVQGLEFRVVG